MTTNPFAPECHRTSRDAFGYSVRFDTKRNDPDFPVFVVGLIAILFVLVLMVVPT